MNLPAALHAAALLIALFVQSMASPLAGAWLLFHLAGCVYMLHAPLKERGPAWYACVAWLLTLGVSTFLLAPVANGAATMWILAAMPSLAMSMRREFLGGYLAAFLIVLTAYALGLVVQLLLHVRYTNFEYFIPDRQSFAIAWPLVDPNNAAAVVNMGLVPCFYMGLRKPRWLALCAVFAFALFATASKAGASAAAVCCLILAGQRYAEKFHTSGLAFIGLVALAFFTPIYGPDMSSWLHHALRDRFPIWADSIRLLALHPFTGTGLGTFAVYYATVRTEYVSGGWFAHNDLLQLAIETGIPAAAAFCILWLTVLLTTCRRNFAAAVTMLAVLLQSMVEFQFYLPSVSLLMGVALAYHRLNNKPSFQGRPSHVA